MNRVKINVQTVYTVYKFNITISWLLNKVFYNKQITHVYMYFNNN